MKRANRTTHRVNCLGAARREDGAAMVEFGLVGALFFTLIFAIIQGGIIFGSWIVVTNATREAARWAAPCIERIEVIDDGVPQGCDDSWGSWTNPETTIENYTLSRIAWPEPADPTWNMASNVWITDETVTAPRLVHVRVTYDVPMFLPLIGVVMPDAWSLFAESSMRIEE